MDAQHLFDILLGVIVSVLGFFAKNTHAKIEKTADSLSDFKNHVAIEYPTHKSIDNRFDKFDEKLDRLGEKLDRIISK